jgi:hypothetical protein
MNLMGFSPASHSLKIIIEVFYWSFEQWLNILGLLNLCALSNCELIYDYFENKKGEERYDHIIFFCGIWKRTQHKVDFFTLSILPSSTLVTMSYVLHLQRERGGEQLQQTA